MGMTNNQVSILDIFYSAKKKLSIWWAVHIVNLFLLQFHFHFQLKIAKFGLVEYRPFPTLLSETSAAYFLYTSVLQAINVVMIWPVHFQKVPKGSEYLCPAKLQIRCDTCCACQSIGLFIFTDSGMLRAIISKQVSPSSSAASV